VFILVFILVFVLVLVLVLVLVFVVVLVLLVLVLVLVLILSGFDGPYSRRISYHTTCLIPSCVTDAGRFWTLDHVPSLPTRCVMRCYERRRCACVMCDV